VTKKFLSILTLLHMRCLRGRRPPMIAAH